MQVPGTVVNGAQSTLDLVSLWDVGQIKKKCVVALGSESVVRELSEKYMLLS